MVSELLPSECTMNDLTVFNFESQPIRTYADENGESWFCFRDVAKVLEISNLSYLKKRLNEKGCRLTSTLTKGGKQSLIFVNEGNLYRMTCRSDKPQAKPFENWVYDEVLPTIRKTGSYAVKTRNSAINLSDIKKSIKAGVKDLFRPYAGRDAYYNIGDEEIVGYMSRWYWTRHRSVLKALEEKDEQIRTLQNKINQIKAVI